MHRQHKKKQNGRICPESKNATTVDSTRFRRCFGVPVVGHAASTTSNCCCCSSGGSGGRSHSTSLLPPFALFLSSQFPRIIHSFTFAQSFSHCGSSLLHFELSQAPLSLGLDLSFAGARASLPGGLSSFPCSILILQCPSGSLGIHKKTVFCPIPSLAQIHHALFSGSSNRKLRDVLHNAHRSVYQKAYTCLSFRFMHADMCLSHGRFL